MQYKIFALILCAALALGLLAFGHKGDSKPRPEFFGGTIMEVQIQ